MFVNNPELMPALRKALTRLAVATCLAIGASACTYLRYAAVQAEYARIQNSEPGQLNLKHMIDRESFMVYGSSIDAAGNYAGLPKAIAAFSSKYRSNERVDTMFFEVAGSHFGLNLPQGQFDLIVFADIDGDGVFESSEAVAQRPIEVNDSLVPDKVLGNVDLRMESPVTIDWPVSIEVPDYHGRGESVYFPSGTIRNLDDPIFDSSFSILGMYDPASFMEQAPTMFYALEEDLVYKIPVVFVHGIGGSAREFESIVDKLDRSRYKPWFFHYPSGGDLDQLAELFYQIFLSGKVYRSGDKPMIVVAHSMGGLIVREAINKYRDKKRETPLPLFISIATPFGGHAAAATGENHGLIVLPSWRDLNPQNAFIGNLYRKPLPEFVHHELIYAYKNPGTIKIGENSDGVVTLTSQLHPPAQRQASGQFGFNNTHTDSLQSEEVFEHIRGLMDTVKNAYPPAQLDLLRQGGYDVPLGEPYSPLSRHMIKTYGKYLMALTRGSLTPFHPEEERFMAVTRGEELPKTEEERLWLRFINEYPEFLEDRE